MEHDETLPASDEPARKDAGTPFTGPIRGGSVLGQYRLIRELGRGGQGLVFLAEDTRLSRKVALKLISPQFVPSGPTLERFHREAESASRLDHPGICAIYDAGEVSGVHYISMRYVDGRTLAEHILEQTTNPLESSVTIAVGSSEEPESPTPTPPREVRPDSSSGRPAKREQISRVLLAIEKTARALHAAHEVGLIHRDIKPGNVILTQEGEPVVLDFGLAREEDSQGGVTISGDLLGTPAYMSPEQIAAQRISLDRRTDIYSLGVTLYECLTLQRPFDAPSTEAMYQRILTADPIDPRKVNPNVSEDLAVVLATAMEKDRERRYKSALDFAEDLRRVRCFEPIAARPAGPLLRFRRWVQRNPVLSTAVLSAFILLTTALAITIVLLRDVSEAKLQKEAALEKEQTASRMLEGALENVRQESSAKQTALESLREASHAKETALEQLREESRARKRALEAQRDAVATAEAERERAESLYLSGRASGLVESLPTQALLLALESVRYRPSALANQVFAEALEQRRETFRLRGLKGPVRSLEFHPNGTFLAAADASETVFVWETASGQPFLRLTGLRSERSSIVRTLWHPRGDRLLLQDDNGRATLWSFPEGRLLTRFEGAHHRLASAGGMHTSPDGSLLLTRSSERTAYLWDVDTGSVEHELRGHVCGISDADFSPDGRLVATAGNGVVTSFLGGDRVSASELRGTVQVRIWSVETGERVLAINRFSGEVSRVRFSSDGASLLVVGRLREANPTQGALLFDVATGELTAGGEEPRPSPWVGGDLSPDGSLLASLNADGSLLVRDGLSSELLLEASDVSPLPALTFTPDGRRLISAQATPHRIRIWKDGKIDETLANTPTPIEQIDTTPDGTWLATGHRDASVLLWNLEEPVGMAVSATTTSSRRVYRDLLSDDASRWVLLGEQRHRIIDAASGGELQRFKPGKFDRKDSVATPGRAINLAFFPPRGDRILFSYQGDQRLRAWTLEGEPAWPSVQYAAPTAPQIFAAVLEGLQRGAARRQDSPFDGTFDLLDLAPDGRHLAILSRRSEGVRILRVDDGSPFGDSWHPQKRKADWVSMLRWTRGGDRLLAVTSDRRARFWNLAQGTEEDASLDLSPHFSRPPGRALFGPRDETVVLIDSHRVGATGVAIDTRTGEKSADVSYELARGSRLSIEAEGAGICGVSAGRALYQDLSTGDLRHLQVDSEPVRALLFSPRPRIGVVVSHKGHASVFDIEELDEPLSILQQGAARVLCAAFDSTGRRLLTACSDDALRIWDVDSRQLAREPLPHSGTPIIASFGDADRHIVSQSADGLAHLWSVSSGEPIRALRGKPLELAEPVQMAVAEPDTSLLDASGHRLAETRDDRRLIVVWNLESGQSAARVEIPGRRLHLLDFSEDGRWLAFASRQEGFRLPRLTRAIETAGSLAIAENTEWQISLVDVEKDTILPGLSDLTWTPGLSLASFRPDGERIALALGGALTVREVPGGAEVASRSMGRQIDSVQWSPEGDRLGTVSRGELGVWNLEDDSFTRLSDESPQRAPRGRRSRRGARSPDFQVRLVFRPESTEAIALSGGPVPIAEVWDLAQGERIESFRLHDDTITDVAFRSDGHFLATASTDRSVRIHDARTWNEWAVYRHEHPVTRVRFSTDGTRVVSITRPTHVDACSCRVWPLDLAEFARRSVHTELTAAERDLYEIGTPEARALLSLRERKEELCEHLRLAQGFRGANEGSLDAGEDVAQLLRELARVVNALRAQTTEPAELQCVRARLADIEAADSLLLSATGQLHLALGDSPSALRDWERALLLDPSAPSGSQLERLRESLLPDLLTYASIDAALDSRERLVEADAEWSFFRGRSEPPPQWHQPSFDDASWERGSAAFGYGKGQPRTVLEDMRGNYTSIYLRRTLEIDDPSSRTNFRMEIECDDAFIAWVNGREVARWNMPETVGIPDHSGTAARALGQPQRFAFSIPAEVWRAGANLIAIAGWNISLQSSDLLLSPTISAERLPDLAADSRRFDAFRAAADGLDASRRRLYLEGRLLERDDQYGEALERFTALVEDDPVQLRPLLSLLRTAHSSGMGPPPLALIRRALSSRRDISSELLEYWWRLECQHAEDPLEPSLRLLRKLGTNDASRVVPHWIDALESLSQSRPLRIDCGSGRRQPPAPGWLGDRFWHGGQAGGPAGRSGRRGTGRRPPEPTKTPVVSSDVASKERWFRTTAESRAGYRLPVPAGNYDVVLHFAETYYDEPGQRIFDVSIEGRQVLDDYEPLAHAAFGRADLRRFENISVQDGIIDLSLQPVVENPSICALEIWPRAPGE